MCLRRVTRNFNLASGICVATSTGTRHPNSIGMRHSPRKASVLRTSGCVQGLAEAEAQGTPLLARAQGSKGRLRRNSHYAKERVLLSRLAVTVYSWLVLRVWVGKHAELPCPSIARPLSWLPAMPMQALEEDDLAPCCPGGLLLLLQAAQLRVGRRRLYTVSVQAPGVFDAAWRRICWATPAEAVYIALEIRRRLLRRLWALARDRREYRDFCREVRTATEWIEDILSTGSFRHELVAK